MNINLLYGYQSQSGIKLDVLNAIVRVFSNFSRQSRWEVNQIVKARAILAAAPQVGAEVKYQKEGRIAFMDKVITKIFLVL